LGARPDDTPPPRKGGGFLGFSRCRDRDSDRGDGLGEAPEAPAKDAKLRGLVEDDDSIWIADALSSAVLAFEPWSPCDFLFNGEGFDRVIYTASGAFDHGLDAVGDDASRGRSCSCAHELLFGGGSLL
jgi:hypothetical protein